MFQCTRVRSLFTATTRRSTAGHFPPIFRNASRTRNKDWQSFERKRNYTLTPTRAILAQNQQLSTHTRAHGRIMGELQDDFHWHKIFISFSGPSADTSSSRSPNPAKPLFLCLWRGRLIGVKYVGARCYGSLITNRLQNTTHFRCAATLCVPVRDGHRAVISFRRLLYSLLLQHLTPE